MPRGRRKSNWHAKLTPQETAELEQLRQEADRIDRRRQEITDRCRRLYDAARKRGAA